MPRDQADDQLEAVLLGKIAEALEFPAGLLAHARAASLGVRARFLAEAILIGRQAGGIERLERLKDVPCREHAQMRHPRRRHGLHVLLD